MKLGILHRDVSPFNVIIKDGEHGVEGMLIDWEFTVEITITQLYSAGGTVSKPFRVWSHCS